MKFEGRVVKQRVATGTKLEHEAVMLVTGAGDYVLRRPGGNAFRDPELDGLVGKTIAGEGVVHGYSLFLSDWHEVSPTHPRSAEA